MSDLNEVGERDNWICWLCDTPVDPDASVNSDRGPSVDSFEVARSKKKSDTVERLAHRSCNTMKGKIAPVVPWPEHLLVVDPSPIVATVDRLNKKGGREAIARCPSREDGLEAASWLLDRLSRYSPESNFDVEVVPGGGQFLLMLKAA
ncbi:hypothetical protein [Aurantimicrobium minutum]|uniref:hypothetical protein n=1 Tax=Aurantimicrobium minutum TaxID=708131 RepID=UPI0024734A34|nr:hypothetical protein [Aurantimicrobium minutum]MDH6423195.1 hypothetical protein [Aurantimicrobium minutum]